MARIKWGHFGAALAGGLVAAIVVSTPTVTAAIGDAVRVGKVSKGNATTVIKGASPATLKLINTTPGEEALQLVVDSGPALRVSNSTRIPRLNADRVDGMHASALGVPSGAVMFFDASTCPSGWSPYTKAQGRMLVGLQQGGTLGGVNGSALTNLGATTTATGGNHNHVWSLYYQEGRSWKTYNQTGFQELLADHGNGIGDEGSGHFPLGPHSSHATGTGTKIYYTVMAGTHTHSVDLPYVQLLACEKD